MERSTGFVILLDYLGIGNYSIEKCEEFIEFRSDIQNNLKGLHALIKTYNNSDIPKDYDLKVRMFGDSILITIKIQKKCDFDILNMANGLIAPIVSDIVHRSLTHKLLVRGAVSFGDFLQIENERDDVTVIGPAITDAARNYEICNWGGVHFTPATSLLLDKIIRKNTEISAEEKNIIKYSIPSKTSALKIWCVNWSRRVVDYHHAHGNDIKEKFYETVSKIEYPSSVADKYLNTIAFFEDTYKETFDFMKKEIREGGDVLKANKEKSKQ